MIRISKAPVPFPVPWQQNIVFMIRPGDVIERGELEADLAEINAGRVLQFQLEAAFKAGLDALLSDTPDQVARLLEIAAADAELKDEESLPAEESAALSAAREAVRSAWPAFASLLAQQARRSELLPTLAFQRFCTGWEGEGLPAYAKGPDGKLRLDVLGELPPLFIRVAGMEAYRLLYATDQAKNSVPPLPSDKSPAPSTSDKSTKKVGSSAKTKKPSAGKKTLSSSSRRRSSPSLTSGSTAEQGAGSA